METEFEHIDTLEYNGGVYVALVPVYNAEDESLEGDGELVILKVLTDEEKGEDVLSTIEDEEEYDEVANQFMERLDDFYEIEH
ncbi:hypothetical protein SDC9_193047 [bioreactor metagenome]|uniref:DUF1292 domain-containing protein n=1 Tax=bioreactor metagenome TaxID=1076179 RepID=A0A645I2U5_9ZZZZ